MENKERKVGERFFLDGKVYETVEYDAYGCRECAFKESIIRCSSVVPCSRYSRKDETSVVFKEATEELKIGERVVIDGEEYITVEEPKGKGCSNCDFKDCELETCALVMPCINEFRNDNKTVIFKNVNEL